MPPKQPKQTVTPDDNVKLLFSVIKFMEGKPDWQKVADDCDIVSPAAAQKRYSRLLTSLGSSSAKTDNGVKASGIGAAGDNSGPSTPEKTSPKKRKSPGSAGGKGKKVKQEQVEDDASGDSGEGQDEEELED